MIYSVIGVYPRYAGHLRNTKLDAFINNVSVGIDISAMYICVLWSGSAQSGDEGELPEFAGTASASERVQAGSSASIFALPRSLSLSLFCENLFRISPWSPRLRNNHFLAHTRVWNVPYLL